MGFKLSDLKELVDDDLKVYEEDTQITSFVIRENKIEYTLQFTDDEGKLRNHRNEHHF
jgi:hypothetical protein